MQKCEYFGYEVSKISKNPDENLNILLSFYSLKLKL